MLQSNYLPWKGYFDLIASVDQMIIYDTAQFTERDWRNRNKIKTGQGLKWLTVPVVKSGRFGQSVEEVEIRGQDWVQRHLSLIEHSYGEAPYYANMRALIEPALRAGHTRLSSLNRDLMERVCQALGITTALSWSRDFPHGGDANQKLVDLCQAAGASVLVCGPAAQSYLDTARLAALGVSVEWFDYSGYREYPQRHGAFEHGVSIIDLLAETGPDARAYLKCGGAQ